MPLEPSSHQNTKYYLTFTNSIPLYEQRNHIFLKTYFQNIIEYTCIVKVVKIC